MRLDPPSHSSSRDPSRVTNGETGNGVTTDDTGSKFKREEIVRLMLQELTALGYHTTAAALHLESGFALESNAVARFRQGVLQGDWKVVDSLVPELNIEAEFISTVMFLIAEQKFLELLQVRDLQAALQVLRDELTTWSFDLRRLHRLSSLMMISDPAVMRSEIGWDGKDGTSRSLLLVQLQKYIPPNVMIPERRLQALVEQAVTLQRLSCLYHSAEDDDDEETEESNLNGTDRLLSLPSMVPEMNDDADSDGLDDNLDLRLDKPRGRSGANDLEGRLSRIRRQVQMRQSLTSDVNAEVGPSNLSTRYPGTPHPGYASHSLLGAGRPRRHYRSISLYSDHSCNRASIFPSVTLAILEEHTDEVWSVAFSHSGKYLASASKDNTAIIWDVQTFTKVHTLKGHTDAVSYLSFSWDDRYLLTCGNDNTIRLWDVQSGVTKATVTEHMDPVTSCAWLPDHRFVSGSLDKNMFLWNTSGTMLHTWTGARITDMDISRDGKTLVAACHEKKIRIYNMESFREIRQLQERENITSLCLSSSARYALVNLASQEVHLWDLVRGRCIRRYKGHKQGRFVIRSCLGGVRESFVVSGSEDSFVYVWHRGQAQLIEVLGGHTATVNSVNWNPKDPYMFASASDDHTIRLWGTLQRAQNGVTTNGT